jgi:DNA-binding NtrC family response regulator
VLFSGERGAGKSKLARLLHGASARRAAPFVSVNCAALPETLLDSELFGHVKGAFVGANDDKVGALEAARDGTLFLQEVQSLPLATQSKLLRALNERQVWPLGSKEPRIMNARVIAATHVDIDQQVCDRDFQSDLLLRLRTVAVHVEPLRARSEDLLPLSKTFLSQLCQRAGCNEKSISVAAAEALGHHAWPGNLRELENVLERALMLCGDGHVIEREHLTSILGSEQGQVDGDSAEIMPIAEIERRYVLQVLDRYKGNRTKTAKALGIGANTLWRKLKGWGVPPARGDSSYPQSYSPLD